MLNIADLLSGLRIVIVPVLLYCAWTCKPTLFLIFLACSLLSDLVDGFVARKLNQVSGLGAKLDSWGDFAIYMTVPICAWWLWPDLIRREAPFVIAVVASYTVPVTLGFLKYGRLTSYHTWGAKLSAVLIGSTALLLFAGGPAWPFHIATPVLVLAELEEIAITAVLPKWRSNVPSFWHAIRLTREKC
jgi:cardiolipin synthase